jgi:hypothetical protein
VATIIEQGGAVDGLNMSQSSLLLLLLMMLLLLPPLLQGWLLWLDSLLTFTLATIEMPSHAPSLTSARKTAAHCTEH